MEDDSLKNYSKLDRLNVSRETCLDFEKFISMIETKNKLNPIGIDYLRKGLDTTILPAFAIGGINSSNINELNQINNLRIAISNAIINADDPFTKTQELFKFLK